MDWRFLVQIVVSLIAMAFGIAIFFTSTTNSPLQSVGTGLVSTVLGLWMRGAKYKPQPQPAVPPV